VDKHAPERITLSNGRTSKVIYDPANPPYIAVQIQHLYGVKQKVKVGMGRANVLVHILAPSQRPVQITDDLASFWGTAYEKVKKELQRKLPQARVAVARSDKVFSLPCEASGEAGCSVVSVQRGQRYPPQKGTKITEKY